MALLLHVLQVPNKVVLFATLNVDIKQKVMDLSAGVLVLQELSNVVHFVWLKENLAVTTTLLAKLRKHSMRLILQLRPFLMEPW